MNNYTERSNDDYSYRVDYRGHNVMSVIGTTLDNKLSIVVW